MLDVTELREPIIAAFGLTNADEAYSFYYDETNNIRKLRLTSDGFNVERPECFVLGGIVHHGQPHPLDVKSLSISLKLQSNVKELKLKHLGKGDFLDLLGSPRIETFLEWLHTQNLLVHYQVTDTLYWSIVDIVDAIIAGSNMKELVQYNWMLKDSLYSLLREDPDGTAEFLGRYEYPNVGKARRCAFLKELMELTEYRKDLLDHYSYYMLKGVLKIAADLKSLPYLEDEKPNMLIDGFGPFFLNRLCIFTRSFHVLDNEHQIQRYLEDCELTETGQPLRHFRFTDSVDEPGVQISDVITGLLGKLFAYVITTPMELMEADMHGLSDIQSRNLSKLSYLLDRSTDESPAFAQYILSSEDQKRAAILLAA